MWGSNLNFSNWRGEVEKQEPRGVVQRPALASEREELWGYKGGGKSKSQLEGVLGFFLFLFFSSGNRTLGHCLQQRAYSIFS
jgi:hypothetical protein